MRPERLRPPLTRDTARRSKMRRQLKRLIAEDDGMQFLEISIVGMVVAVAAIQLSSRAPAFNAELAHLGNDLLARFFP
jgi:hypothetical protein